MEIALVLGFPLLGGLLLALVGHKRWAPEINALMSLITLVAAAALTRRVITDGPMTALEEQFFVDPFNVFLVALTAFVGFTTALFSRPYMRIEEHHGRLNPARLRLYHSMYQLFSFTMVLCLLSNNIGILWVALEGATLATVLLVSLYRTPASLEAAWKYFILCSVGIAQALFGIILLYFAAERVLGPGGSSLLWTHLYEVRGELGRNFSGGLMMGFGLLSVVVAAFFLSRQKDIKRMFAYSSIEHMGIVTFAFGMGGPVAAFAGLLHMTLHSLTKSAIFFTVGPAAQKAGTQNMDDIRGLIEQSPTIGWGLALGSLAILGMPPFGVFTSEFMVLTTPMHEHPWATPFLLVALGVAFAAIFGKVQPMVFGETTAQRLPHPPALVPVFVHLAIVLMLGLYIPPYLVDWYRQAAAFIG